MLGFERCREEAGVGYLVPCWLQEPAWHYNTLISVSAISLCSHLQWVNETIRLALAFPLPGGHISDWAVLLRGQCRWFLY